LNAITSVCHFCTSCDTGITPLSVNITSNNHHYPTTANDNDTTPSKNDPMNLLPIITDSTWEIIDKSKKPKIISKPVTDFVPAIGSIPPIKTQNKFSESEHVNKKLGLWADASHGSTRLTFCNIQIKNK
jgi:hypothetical protein